MNKSGAGLPDFESKSFLDDHITKTLRFYEAGGTDPDGGFFHCYRDDGSIYDRHTRHLVSSARFVINYSTAWVTRREPGYRRLAEHGLRFLRDAHRHPDGSYAWMLRDGRPCHQTVMAYGHAFAMLASAAALTAGLEHARTMLREVWGYLESRFWSEEHGAYADEFDPALDKLLDYRGQNANMHMCEACIAAWEATLDSCFLERAEILAEKFARCLARESQGMVWEHYRQDWSVDFDYNVGKPDDLFKPWGFQPGHQIEWSRLLLTLEQIRSLDWYPVRAVELYDLAMKHGKDQEFGGIVYGFAPNGEVASGKKYYWVHSEAFATAWRLYHRTGDDRFRQDYNEIWQYSWKQLVDHRYGAWFRVLERDGSKVDDLKSPPGKADYHTVMACWDVLRHT